MLYVDVVAETSRWTSKIRAIRRLLTTVAEQVQRKAPKIYDERARRTQLRATVLSSWNIDEAGIAERQTASVYLATLADIGILRDPSGRP